MSEASAQELNKTRSAINEKISLDEINKRLDSHGAAIEILQERSRRMDVILNDIFSGLHWLKHDLEETELLKERAVTRPSRQFAKMGIKRIRTQEVFL